MLAVKAEKPSISIIRIMTLYVCLAYILSVFFLPRFFENFRYEDFLTPLLLLLPLVFTDRRLWYYSWLVVPYILYSFFVTVFYVVVEILPITSFLIWGKEVQYFLLYAVVLLVAKESYARELIYAVVKMGIFSACLFGLWSLISGQQSYYGIGYINDYSSTISSIMYFSFFVLSLVIYEREGERVFLYTGLICAVLTFMVGARSGQVMVMIFLFLYLFKLNLKSLIVVLIMILAIGLIALFSEDLYDYLYHVDTSNQAFNGAISRMSTMLTPMETIEGSRFNSWKSMLEAAYDRNIVFGCGRGCSHLDDFAYDANMPLGLGGDNQYTVNLVEIGIIGSVLFFMAVVLQLVHVKNHRKLYFAYLVTYFAAGVVVEVWQLSRGGFFFWFITALLLSEDEPRVKEQN